MPASADDAKAIDCSKTIFRMDLSGFTCDVVKGLSGDSSANGQFDFYEAWGERNDVFLWVQLGSAGLESVFTPARKAETKETILENAQIDDTQNWSEPIPEKGGFNITFTLKDDTCLGFIRQSEPRDQGYLYNLVGYACTDKNRKDKAEVLKQMAASVIYKR